MAKSDTWPGGVAMEALTTMDSAGSCDSVISVNSGCSDDSMEHLSAEERACLMYLEETIEALEVQEDSGLSNDEPDLTEKTRRRRVADSVSCGLVTPPTASNDDTPEELRASASDTTTSASRPSTEVELGLIPPPSDFMDRPEPPPQPQDGPRPSVTGESLPDKPWSEAPQAPPGVTSPPPGGPPPSEEPRSPPAVAPKPKKLPANIVLKSHRASAADGHPTHSAVAGGDRLLSDPQRIRMEALRKLGLLRSDGADAAPGLSPTLSPKSRRSWAAPPYPPSSPGAPPSAPSYVHSPAPASAPSSPAAAGLLPAPAAFSDPVTPPRSPPALLKELMSPRADADARSAHVGWSGGGTTPEGVGGGHTHADFQHSGDAQKLPRSQGISVLICPRAENGENRREALRKLGLLRD